MNQRSSIVSFDDARRSSRGRRLSSSESSRRAPSGRSLSYASARAGRFADAGAADPFAVPEPRGSRASSRRGAGAQPRAALERYERAEGSSRNGAQATSFIDKLAGLRKAYSKERADRRFDRQYGSADKGAASAAGPRAAVYKGEMGSQHKRAARELDAPAAKRGGSTAGTSAKRKRSLPLPLAVIGGAVACLAVTFAILYAPAQQYYQEVRENDRLEAEYAAVSERNDTIRSEVDALSTAAGVENRAREEFGMVRQGETAGSVSGIDVPEEESSFTGNIVSSAVEPPDTWYSFLDPFFGVE